MERPTNQSQRLIPEGAVVALVQGKIDALDEKVAVLAQRTDRGACAERDEYQFRAGALRTVITGLTFIPTADPDAVLRTAAQDAITVLEGLVHPALRRDNDVIARLKAALGVPDNIRQPEPDEEDEPHAEGEYFVTSALRGRWHVREPSGRIVNTYATRAAADAYAAEQTKRHATPAQRFVVQENEDSQWCVIDTASYATVSRFDSDDEANSHADYLNAHT